MADNGDSAASGGLLVVLGIIVAVAIIYFFFGMKGGTDKPDVSIEMPDVNVTEPATPATK